MNNEVKFMVSKDNFSIKIVGIPQLLKKLDLVYEGIADEVDELLKDFTKEYYKEIQDSAPYDTGLYHDKWYWNQTNLGRFVIWNDVSQVYNSEHYSGYLVYGLNKFKSTASKMTVNEEGHVVKYYKYSDPLKGILHDISQINTVMQSVIERKLYTFSVNKAINKVK